MGKEHEGFSHVCCLNVLSVLNFPRVKYFLEKPLDIFFLKTFNLDYLKLKTMYLTPYYFSSLKCLKTPTHKC